MDKIARLRQEIERRINILTNVYDEQMERKDEEMMTYYHGKVIALEELRPFLDTLSEEPDKSLEEEMEKFGERWPYPASFDGYDKDWVDELTEECAKHFYELGQSQMPMPEDTVLFNKGVAEGRRLEKEEKDLGWISVKDRLPEKDGWYFTCIEMSGVPQCVGLSHFETYSGQWDDDDDSIELVDYWMEIPALPKEEEK